MENDNQPVTKKELRETLDEAFAKFSQDILMPAFESIEARFDAIDKRFEALETEMHTGFNDINAELFSIKQEITEVKVRLERLEKRTKEDSDVAGQDIGRLEERLKKVELRLSAQKT